MVAKLRLAQATADRRLQPTHLGSRLHGGDWLACAPPFAPHASESPCPSCAPLSLLPDAVRPVRVYAPPSELDAQAACAMQRNALLASVHPRSHAIVFLKRDCVFRIDPWHKRVLRPDGFWPWLCRAQAASAEHQRDVLSTARLQWPVWWSGRHAYHRGHGVFLHAQIRQPEYSVPFPAVWLDWLAAQFPIPARGPPFVMRRLGCGPNLTRSNWPRRPVLPGLQDWFGVGT